jgi:YD repeat-containing protein
VVGANTSGSTNATYVTSTAGAGTLTLTANQTGAPSDNGSYNVTVTGTIGPLVTPDGGTTTVAGQSAGLTAAYTVQNRSTASQIYSFTCAVTGQVSGCTPPGNLTVPANSSGTANLTYSTGLSGSGTLTLTANQPGGATDNGSYNVTVTAPLSPLVTPDGGTTNAVGQSAGLTASFTVQNRTAVSQTYTFTCARTGQVAGCTAPGNLVVAANSSGSTNATYTTSLAGAGTLTLTANQAGAASDNGSYNVTVTTPLGPLATPDGAATTAPPNTASTLAAFTVQNRTAVSQTYTFTCARTGQVSGCNPPGSLNVAAGASGSTSLTYSTTTVGAGTVTLTANQPGGPSDNASYNVTVTTTPAPLVTPDGGTTTAAGQSNITSPSFTITNRTTASQTYTFTCGRTGQVLACTAPSSLTIGANSTGTRTVAYTTSLAGTGTLTLIANQPGGLADTGSFNVTVNAPPAPLVTPDNGTLNVVGQTTGLTASFTVQNQTNVSQVYTFSCARTGQVASCTAPANLTVPASSSLGTSVPYTAGTAGSGTLTLTANQTGASSDNGSYNVTVTTPLAPLVTPDGGTVTVAGGGSGFTAAFTVQNRTGVSQTYTFSCARTGSVATCTPPGNLVVNASSSGTANLSYTSGAAGSGTLTLTANQTGSSPDNGSYNVTVTASLAPTIALKNFNRDNQDRSMCLAAAAGDAAQVRCGDLMAFHGMPAFRSLGQNRSLTLVYNSQAAAPRPLVAANVTLAAGTAPLNVYAELKIGAAVRASGTYSTWASGATRQIALAFDASDLQSGLYAFTLLMRSVYSGSVHDATINDTLMIVNRRSSEFGVGWYPVGVEQLILGQAGAPIMWIGGDGSAKIYGPFGTDQWRAPAGAYRDLIVKLPNSNYERRLQHGVIVTFDAAGHHIQTKNRLGHISTFVWDGNGRLSQITVPGTGG